MKTYFFDIDGTLIKRAGPLSTIIKGGVQAQKVEEPGMADLVCDLHSRGDKIVITTARPESMREMTKKMLNKLGFVWDHLLMGLGVGARIVVNDYDRPEPFRAFAVNILVDSPSGNYADEIRDPLGRD